ncbi:coiled-coil domain-containing protein 175 [Eptesicus fuscus]|uniref:coiled-coil domain-containing protein 175 n=1 Tax=Eptesicus fuscus TaxID=29078 RepID=UPI0024042ED9|nr:coiled-coil domain-containing protein 175 [Eptesicus fuscus]
MALHSWSPELGFSDKQKQVAVSTGPSLDLSTFPSTLGSTVATAVLEQLFIVEQSLQSGYFKCNEDAKIFLKDIAISVKRLEELRNTTIELLEIESMELSRLYFLLETLPDNINTELEEFVIAARKLNLFEIKQLRMKIARLNNEIEFLKTRLADLKEINQDLGEQQKDLAKQHEKLVVLLNHAMEKKAMTTIYINETYTKINLEKEETKLQKKYIQAIEEIIEKERGEYLKKKKKLSDQISEYEKICESKKQEAFHRKKELDKLRIKELNLREKVTTSTLVLSDHNMEIAELNESIRHWEKQVEEMKKICNSLEENIYFLKNTKNKLGEKTNIEKNEYLQKIKEVAEKIYKAQLENKELQEKLQTLNRQYKIVLLEEDKVLSQKRKIQEENNKQMRFISDKENFLSQRKVDIKNMEEGLVTLSELHRATQEVYRKHIKILNENMEREIQRCVLTQWKIACLSKRHARWLLQMRDELQAIMDQIRAAEDRRNQLIEETSFREKEITENLTEIEKVTLDLKQTETEFVVKEKKLIQELNKYEEKIVKEKQSTKIKEDELVTYLPKLHGTEEEYKLKNKRFQELGRILLEQKQEQNLLNDQISQMTREFTRQVNSMNKLKQELQQLRSQESHRIRSHFEILKNLENEIYVHDLETEALLLENERLKQYIAHIKTKIEPYAQEASMSIFSDLSWHLVANHAQYLDLWAEFQFTIKEFVCGSEDTLQEIKGLIDRLCARDEKIEQISIWLEGNLEELRFLATMEFPEKTTKQKRFKKVIKKVRYVLAAFNLKNIVTKKN